MNKKYKFNKQKFIKRITEMMICLIFVVITVSICNKGTQLETIDYTYDTGNTVWEIAEKHCPREMDIRDMAKEIEKINNIKNSTIQSYVFYKVPIYQR